MSNVRPHLRLRTFAVCSLGCAIAAGAYLLVSDRPAPADAAAGQPLGDFVISAPSDTPANVSLDMRAHMAQGALHVEKLESFFEPGIVPPPTMTKGEDGSAFVHIWVTRPRVRLFSTKCEFVRTVRFSIPKPNLTGARKLVLVNHDTGTTQVLADAEFLGRLLREPEAASGEASWQSNLSATGSGCGA
jgi:hypothetical protein